MIFVSDLHVGRPTFKRDKFMAFLDYVKTTDHGLAGLGDMYEGWQFTYGELRDCEDWPVLERLNDMLDVSIRGNHDWLLQNKIFPKVKIADCIDIAGWRCVHAHQFDPALQKPWMWKLAAEMDEVTAEMNIDIFNYLKSKIGSGTCDNATIMRQIEALGRWLCAHTHAGAQGNLYMNTGSWCDDVCTYVMVNTDGSAQLRVWD